MFRLATVFFRFLQKQASFKTRTVLASLPLRDSFARPVCCGSRCRVPQRERLPSHPFPDSNRLFQLSAEANSGRTLMPIRPLPGLLARRLPKHPKPDGNRLCQLCADVSTDPSLNPIAQSRMTLAGRWRGAVGVSLRCWPRAVTVERLSPAMGAT